MRLRILHLSDLHFTREDSGKSTHKTAAFNAKLVTTAMLAKIKELAETDPIHLAVITGDIAFSGKKEEYNTAAPFCRDLLKTTGLSKDFLFIVPGNHDVNRTDIELLLHKKMFYSFDTQDEITALLNNSDITPILMKKLKNYNYFANTTTNCPNLSVKSFFYSEPVLIENFMVNLAGLNSALFAGYDGDDKSRLALGIFQVNNTIQRLNNQALLNIGIFHHPFSCFHEVDEISENMLMNHMHIILTGHLHKPRPSFLHTGAGKAVIIGAGASFETRESYNSFAVVDIDLSSGKGYVQFYKYLPGHNLWKENMDMGRFPFQIDSKKGRIFSPVVTGKGNPQKYLRFVHDECAYINVQGLQVGSGKAHKFNIDELYIPLTTSSLLSGKEKTVEKEMSRLYAPDVKLDRALREQHLTIIGDPGSGKTTFVRRIAYLLVRALLYKDGSEEKLGLPKNTFPVLIRTSELAHHMDVCRQMKKPDCPPLDTDTRWLIHFLKEKSMAFHWELSEEYFTDRCQSKNTLIMIDGLDEAPDRKTRENICTLLSNAVKAWPDTRLIVTSRPVAYTGRSVLADFSQVAIADLTDTSISGFLDQWTQAVHHDCLDQATIDTYYNELMNALTARPEIKRMAVNPVMLTALAVVHWNEKRLPEQRVDLCSTFVEPQLLFY